MFKSWDHFRSANLPADQWRPQPARSDNFATEQAIQTHLGLPITTLETTSQTPLLVQFHRRDIDHFTVDGPTGSGKTVTMTFLLAQKPPRGAHSVGWDLKLDYSWVGVLTKRLVSSLISSLVPNGWERAENRSRMAVAVSPEASRGLPRR